MPLLSQNRCSLIVTTTNAPGKTYFAVGLQLDSARAIAIVPQPRLVASTFEIGKEEVNEYIFLPSCSLLDEFNWIDTQSTTEMNEENNIQWRVQPFAITVVFKMGGMVHVDIILLTIMYWT